MDVPEFVIIRIEVEPEPEVEPVTNPVINLEIRKPLIAKPIFYVERKPHASR